MDKTLGSVEEALADLSDGCSVAIAGFGIGHRFPTSLIVGLRDKGTRNLTVVCNSLGEVAEMRAQLLAESEQISKLVASFSARPGMRSPAEDQIEAGEMELELVPQGILVERMRAAAAGIPAFYSPVGVDTVLADGKEVRNFGGRDYVLEEALPVDFAFVRAYRADRRGNLQFRGGSENFNPSFAKAARVTIAEVDEVVETGEIAPADVGLSGVFVDRVIVSSTGLSEEAFISNAAQRKGNPDARRTYNGKPALSRLEMAARAAELLPDEGYVNLGVGIPTLVSNFVAERGIFLHAENGILGYGGLVEDPNDLDPDIYNAGGQFVTLLPGAAFMDSVASFEIARSGRLDAVVLGAYQVDERGSLANWSTPQMVGGGMGGAMDLVVPENRVIVVMNIQDRQGRPKLVERCTFPLTGEACVESVVTDVGLFTRREGRMELVEVAPGFTPDEVASLLDFPVAISDRVSEVVVTI